MLPAAVGAALAAHATGSLDIVIAPMAEAPHNRSR